MRSSRRPSADRVLRYIREEMVDGATEDAVLSGGYCRKKPVVTVRWRVWARLRAENYSFPAIAYRFSVDHTTVLSALKVMREGKEPLAHHRIKPVVISQPKKTACPKTLLPFPYAGFDRTERALRGQEPA